MKYMLMKKGRVHHKLSSLHGVRDERQKNLIIQQEIASAHPMHKSSKASFAMTGRQIGMHHKGNLLCLVCIACSLLFTACSKTKMDGYASTITQYTQYFQLHEGDVRIYRLDSTVTAPFGTALRTHSYLLKDSVGSFSVQNGTDTTYSIYRYMTDTLQALPWKFCFRYRKILKKNTAERIDEQNRRFIILVTPISEGNTWDGNRYFITDDNQNQSSIYYNWDYHYENINTAFKQFSNTITVNQAEIILGNKGDFDVALYQAKTISKEIYASGKGLVYKELLHTIYQPNGNNPGSFGNYTDDSYGIKMTLLP